MDPQSNSVVTVLAIALCFYTLWEIKQNWSSFWAEPVTTTNRHLAQRLAIFLLVPLGVLLHEIGHSLATWQVGGTVSEFYWGFYHGYIIPSGRFTAAEAWWIAFSGNLVSICLGLMPIPVLHLVRRRIVAEILYSFACAQLVFSLAIYPLLSLSTQQGDWVIIYNRSIQPYMAIALVANIGLLVGLWQLLQSQPAIQWRLAREPKALDRWKTLQASVAAQPNDLEARLAAVYCLMRHRETRAARQMAAPLLQQFPDAPQVAVLSVVLLFARKSYRQVIARGAPLLDTDLADGDRLRLCRVICLSHFNLKQYSEALVFANRGLELDTSDYHLRWNRAALSQQLGNYQQAKLDWDMIRHNAPDEQMRRQAQQLLDALHQ